MKLDLHNSILFAKSWSNGLDREIKLKKWKMLDWLNTYLHLSIFLRFGLKLRSERATYTNL